MRRALAVAILLFAARAEAVDVRVLGGADLLLTTDPNPGGTVTDAEIGLSLRADVRDLGNNRADLKLDFRARESILGHDTNSTVNELYELSANIHLVKKRLDLKIGRFPAPGGYWLVLDGAMLVVRYTDWLSQSFFGGLRSFTTGRRNTWMDSNPMALPVAGTSLTFTHKIVSASLTFAWAQDGIDLHLEWTPDDRNVLERHIEDEYFLDGVVTVFPTEKLNFSAGGSLGTRYDIQFNATNPYGPTTLGVATVGAFGAYALAEYRPLRTLRLTYTFNFERVRLLQSQLLVTKADGTPVTTADGSFEDHVLRAVWRLWHGLRADAQYRLRFRANTDVEHHVTIGLRGDELWRGLGGYATLGVDIDTLQAKQHNRAIYEVGISYMRAWLDLRGGILFTDGIGSGLLFSQHVPTASGSSPTELFPYVLETNRVAYLRGFATFWKMFAGLDLEENLDAAQLRMMAQLGVTL